MHVTYRSRVLDLLHNIEILSELCKRSNSPFLKMGVLYMFPLFLYTILSLFLICPLMAEETLSHTVRENSFEERLSTFLDLVRALNHDGMLDGEILVEKQGEVILHVRSPEVSFQKKESTPLYMIGSDSKQFASVALLKALYETSSAESEEEKIADVIKQLHRPLSSFLDSHSPLWENAMPSWANTITLHHLLSQTSGIEDYTDIPAYSEPDCAHGGKIFYEVEHSPAEVLNIVKKLPLLFQPGSKYAYSNTNYFLIPFVIEAVTKISGAEYLSKKIFVPLSLNNTSFVYAGRWPDLHGKTEYHNLVHEWNFDIISRTRTLYPPALYTDLSNAIGAGSLISSVHDLLKWNRALYEDHFLPNGLLTLFTTPNLKEYGYGIKITDHDYGKVFQHEGDIDTFQTELLYFQEEHLSVIYISPIIVDIDKVEKVADKWSHLLEKVIPDPVQRRQEIIETLKVEYPDRRDGTIKIQKLLTLLFDIDPVSRE